MQPNEKRNGAQFASDFSTILFSENDAAFEADANTATIFCAVNDSQVEANGLSDSPHAAH